MKFLNTSSAKFLHVLEGAVKQCTTIQLLFLREKVSVCLPLIKKISNTIAILLLAASIKLPCLHRRATFEEALDLAFVSSIELPLVSRFAV